MKLVAVCVIAACTPTYRESPSRSIANCPRAEGSPADFAPPAIDGIVISPVEDCGENEGLIRVARASGTRTLGDAGCTKAPDPADASACPVIAPILVPWIARDHLSAHQVGTDDTGLTLCNATRGNATRIPAISTHDWRNAAAVVEGLAVVLTRFDIAGDAYVAVRRIPCMSL
jgi:hypothetical protein